MSTVFSAMKWAGFVAMAFSLNACIIVRSPGDDFEDDRFDDEFDGDFDRGPRGPGGGPGDDRDRFDEDPDTRFVRDSFEPLERATLPSPTNAFADDPEAARLGERIFSDERYSSDGTVSCESCHDPRQGFSDPRQFSLGVEGREGGRHAPGIVNPGLQEWVLWDGVADSLRSQPVRAPAPPLAMTLKRTEIVHLTASLYGRDYEAVFGALPDLRDIPTGASPGDLGWQRMSSEQVHDVEEVVANVGKAIAAFERTITCTDTRFDRFLRGENTLSQQEIRGAALFEEVGCASCHSGANFTDQRFHNIGIGSPTQEGAEGRPAVLDALLEDPFNGAGPYSDDTGAGRDKLDSIGRENSARGSFKTPSLRGVTQRPRFMHNGSFDDVRRVIQFYASDDARQDGAVGEVDSVVRRLRASRDEQDDIAAFLFTLECP